MRVTISASGRGRCRRRRVFCFSRPACRSGRRGAGEGGDHGPQATYVVPATHTHCAHELLLPLLREILAQGEGDDSGRDPSSRNGRLTVRGTPFFCLNVIFLWGRESVQRLLAVATDAL
jgi:hypothetical protein